MKCKHGRLVVFVEHHKTKVSISTSNSTILPKSRISKEFSSSARFFPSHLPFCHMRFPNLTRTKNTLVSHQGHPIALLLSCGAPSIPKWLSVFFTLARFRPIDHWASNWKYDPYNEKTTTTPKHPPKLQCPKTSWWWKFGAEVFDFERHISSHADKPDNHFGTKKNPGVGQSFWDKGSTLCVQVGCLANRMPRYLRKLLWVKYKA